MQVDFTEHCALYRVLSMLKHPSESNLGSVDLSVDAGLALSQVRARPLPITFYQHSSPHTVSVRTLILSNNRPHVTGH